MTAGDWLVAAVTVLYIGAAIAYGLNRNWPSVIVFIGYAIANVGVIWMAVGGVNEKHINISRGPQGYSESDWHGFGALQCRPQDESRTANCIYYTDHTN